MKEIKATEFIKSNIWKVKLDISLLRDFTALDEFDAQQLISIGLNESQAKKLISQSDVTIVKFNEGERVPLNIFIDAYKFGRILAKNKDFICFDSTGGMPDVIQLVSSGMMYELGQPKRPAEMMYMFSCSFKVNTKYR